MGLNIDRPKRFVFNEQSNETIHGGINRPPFNQQPINFEPKRQNRFIFDFPNEFDIPEWVVRGITRPSLSLIGLDFKWNDIVVELYDPIIPCISQKMINLWDSRIVHSPHNYILKTLDPTGVVVEQWLINGRITQIDFGEMCISSDGLITIQMVIQPNYCVIQI